MNCNLYKQSVITLPQTETRTDLVAEHRFPFESLPSGIQNPDGKTRDPKFICKILSGALFQRHVS